MEFGKFGGLGNLATLAGLGGIGKGSNNFLIWALLAVIVFGFGKGRSVLETAFLQFGKVPDNKHQSRRRYKGTVPVASVPLMGFGSFGKSPISSFLGGNGLFIIVVIALLLLCRDKANESVNDTYSDQDEINID